MSYMTETSTEKRALDHHFLAITKGTLLGSLKAGTADFFSGSISPVNPPSLLTIFVANTIPGTLRMTRAYNGTPIPNGTIDLNGGDAIAGSALFNQSIPVSSTLEAVNFQWDVVGTVIYAAVFETHSY